MKDVIYDPALREAPELLEAARQASKRLEKILERSGRNVQAEWKLAQGEDELPRVSLRIWDAKDESKGSFSRDEFLNPMYLNFSLYGLWDDILKARSYRMLEGLEGNGQGGA